LNKQGLWYAFGAYGLWGLLPVYWKLLQAVPAFEILLHRMVWSLLFLSLLLWASGRWRGLWTALGNRRTVAIYAAAATLLSVNWWLYIWAVNSGFIVETSLGYFINPLVSVALGVVFFKERLRRLQWLAIGLAAFGVGYLTIVYGRPPWISLALALSFALYGSLKKIAPLGASEGLAIETALMSAPALVLLVSWQIAGTASLGAERLSTDLLLIGSGAVTALPLLFFGAAARRLPLSMIGIMQYGAPTIQFLLGVLVYGEPFDSRRLVGFSFIWLALALFTADGLLRRRTRPAPGG
jgi:chloramphenicol-sensitive protein RarD